MPNHLVPDDPTPLLAFEATEGAVSVDLERLLVSRLIISASSGGGKSWALRYLLEQTQDRIQQFVIDPEGEFASLRERHDYLLVGSQGELPAVPSQAHVLARRLMALGSSAVMDLSDLRLADRHLFVKGFLEGLRDLPPEEWHSVLVVLDEIQIFCPETGRGESIAKEAVEDEANLGRKRGQCLCGATQRIANVSNNALAAMQNKLIGATTLDTDVRRASSDLGFSTREQRHSLKLLEPGHFYALGPAISREPVLVRTGPVHTTHPRPGAVMPPAPPAPAAIRALVAQLQDLPAAAAEDLDLDGARQRIAELERRAAVGDANARDGTDRGAARALHQEVDRLQRELADARSLIANMELGRDRRLEALTRMRESLGPVVAELNVLLGEPKISDEPNSPLSTDQRTPVPRIPPVPREHRRPPVSAAVGPRATATRNAAKPRRSQTMPASSLRPRADGGFSLDELARKLLAAVAEHPTGCTKERLRILVGYAFEGDISTSLNTLRMAGLIEGREEVRITQVGQAELGEHERPLVGLALFQAWANGKSKGAQAILHALVSVYPATKTRLAMAREAGYSDSSGSINAGLQELKPLGIVEGDGEYRLTDAFAEAIGI